jgi:hypothetical protein
VIYHGSENLFDVFQVEMCWWQTWFLLNLSNCHKATRCASVSFGMRNSINITGEHKGGLQGNASYNAVTIYGAAGALPPYRTVSPRNARKAA